MRAALLVAALLALLTGSVSAHTLTPPAAPSLPPHGERAVCEIPLGNDARCFSHVVTLPNSAAPLATTSYSNGYGPADLQSAYALAGAAPSGHPTVAIVDAYDNPNARADLAAYRAQFGLSPLCSNTVSTGCVTFSQVNQTGGSTLPSGNTGWGQEIDLDIEMVSAICPACNILLVEAASNSFANLGAAANYAAGAAGVVAESNSYGSNGEFSGETSPSYNAPYNHTGVAITASSGDNGYGVSFPAASNAVVAVGGTSLSRSNSSRGWSESVWSGAGSGCSAYFAAQSWQPPLYPSGTSCSTRVVADVSAVADPNTGVAVYDSYGSTGGANWYVFGGTSVASPIVASMFAIGSTAVGSGQYAAQVLYSHAAGFNDVTSGSNGRCTGNGRRGISANAFLCTGIVGYDGPSGLGTPRGPGGF